jgi:hypothetical protein
MRPSASIAVTTTRVLRLLRSGLLRLFRGFQHLFWSRAHSDVLREIYPADYAVRINEELRRACDICSLRPCALMQHIVPPNHLRLRIGQERIGVAKFLTLVLIDFRRVHANRNDLNPARFKVPKSLLKTPQLGVTQWSPETTIKNQRDGFGSANKITKRDVFAILI